MSGTFASAFEKYITDAQAARAEDKSEQQRKRLFLSFLQDAFNIEAAEIDVERPIILANNKYGFVDALFGDLLFEFKRRMDTGVAKAREQLKEYLTSSAKRREYVGFLTDGLKFEVHILDGDDLRQTDSFELKADDPDGAFIRLDAYLFSQKAVPPTSADIVVRFGGNSPTFQAAFRALRGLLDKVQGYPALTMWRDQWSKLLSKVYGSDVGDDNLYLRHTYLCQLARLLAYAALMRLPDDDETIEGILSGQAFFAYGMSNIAENDFYSWVLLPEVKKDAVKLFRQLAMGLVVYDLKRIDQDLLKQLYQNLVDPATRHELGEYYTPDWLAELTLDDIDYRYPQSLLDPACGSGSFLFAAIKRLAATGTTGWELVQFALENVVGMDVHPLAVVVARINYLLALVEHLRGERPAEENGLVALPVYMADALARTGNANGDRETLPITVNDERDERFFIPITSASGGERLDAVVDYMHRLARRDSDPFQQELELQRFLEFVKSTFVRKVNAGVIGDLTPTYWRNNLRLLTTLIREKRNGIWAYILKNQARPILLAQRKFDAIVGNPPWLSYRFIKSPDYQKDVKQLSVQYKLIESDDVKLFTQMDLSTLFFVHARETYLKAGGTLAFVMPRAVITGAKQHRPFQAQGMTRVLDLKDVTPLFNVETCVVVLTLTPQPPLPHGEGEQSALSQGGSIQQEIPAVRYRGKLPRHEMNLDEALPLLTKRQTTVKFVDSEVRGSYYYERFQQGATLVPRNLCFVKPEKESYSPAVMTDPDVDRDAKPPYKGVQVRGVVGSEFSFATLLSKHLIPFGYERLHLVALPFRVGDDGMLQRMMGVHEFDTPTYNSYEEWFIRVEKKWDSLKKKTTPQSLFDYVNYRNKLVSQTPRKGIKVLYNASGTHISACVIDAEGLRPKVYERDTQGLVVDTKLYLYNAESQDEAQYVCALLNAPCVDQAIKAYQTRGIYKGERDIHRTPFEACAMPPFDAGNADHIELARLSQAAHAKIEALKTMGGLTGNVYAIRDQARAAVADELTAIDTVARRVLGL